MPTRKKSNHAVVGVFETRARAEKAIADLKAAGFDDGKIGMVYRNADGETVKTGAADDNYAGEGAAIGVVAGAAGGAAIGAGILAGVIPVIGPVLALGTLGTILANAAGGAAIAGIAGALIGWGIPEEDASFYESEVSAGRYLVTVEANGREVDARAILQRNGGFDRLGWDAVRSDRANTLAEGGFRGDNGQVIRLHEEHLRANKHMEDVGEVKVRKEVHTEHEQITVPVEREEVVVERRPASGAATGDMKTQEIRIPVKEERVNVTKEPVVTEEVTVAKRKVREPRTVTGEVRKEDVTVESSGKARVRNSTRPGKK